MAYETGDTIRVKGTFRNWAPEGQTGTLIATADVTGPSLVIYDGEGAVTNTHTPVAHADGYFYHDWILPSEPGNYTIEFRGLVDSNPVLVRTKIKVKFDVS